jgi:hypothetical protein
MRRDRRVVDNIDKNPQFITSELNSQRATSVEGNYREKPGSLKGQANG